MTVVAVLDVNVEGVRLLLLQFMLMLLLLLLVVGCWLFVGGVGQQA